MIKNTKNTAECKEDIILSETALNLMKEKKKVYFIPFSKALRDKTEKPELSNNKIITTVVDLLFSYDELSLHNPLSADYKDTWIEYKDIN